MCDMCGCDCDGDCYGDSDDDPAKYIFFIAKLKKAGFRQLDQGSTRRAYARGNIVIKVPLDEDGEIDNRVEAAVWRKYKSQPTDLGVYLAPCRLLPNNCLMMVLATYDTYETIPDWAKFIDSRQVGKYKDKFVAYDYALDVTERIGLERMWGTHSDFFHNQWIKNRPYLVGDYYDYEDAAESA